MHSNRNVMHMRKYGKHMECKMVFTLSQIHLTSMQKTIRYRLCVTGEQFKGQNLSNSDTVIFLPNSDKLCGILLTDAEVP